MLSYCVLFWRSYTMSDFKDQFEQKLENLLQSKNTNVVIPQKERWQRNFEKYQSLIAFRTKDMWSVSAKEIARRRSRNATPIAILVIPAAIFN